MDAKRFDAVTKSLISETNRRQALSGLLAGGLRLFAPTESDEAVAKTGKCKPKCGECHTCKGGRCKKSNRGKKRCKHGTCQPKPAGTPCAAPTGGATCQQGVCTCPGSATACGGVCQDLTSDTNNCGSCGMNCPTGQTCCNGTCVDLATNGANCGACGHACATNLCLHGACDCQNLAVNCPAGCSCGVREEGGTVCFAGIAGPACTIDAECPLRSSCLGNNSCSVPCLL
jgi:hypothetical protein